MIIQGKQAFMLHYTDAFIERQYMIDKLRMHRDLKFPIHPAKRIFDIIFSLCVIIISSPLTVFFLCAIALEHTLRLRPFDPLFYSETRFSQGKPFTLYKFNIFRYNIIQDMRARGEFIYTKKLEHNGSLLYVGWLLKQIYLDEFPQFFNILRGDMSVVGPRPVNSEVHTLLLERGITDKEKVRAGLTGYYQQRHKYARGITQEIADRMYVEFYEENPWYKILLFDIQIIVKTLAVLIRAKGV